MKVLTFDIEEWFHILDNNSTKTHKEWARYECRIHANMDRILDFLDETDQKATFFCLGWIAEKYPEVIKEISNRGYEIGSHTYMHQLIYDQNRLEFKDDLKASIEVLEDTSGKKVKSFRAPGFSLISQVLWAFEELVEQGIEFDSSIFPARRAHGGISGFSESRPHILEYEGKVIKEFPISTTNILGNKLVYSGGGYFRFAPYGLIKSLTSSTDYVMTYFHPRDFDAGQPIINDLPAIRKFKSYYGLKGALDKLRRYTRDFAFIDLATANERIDWEQSKHMLIDGKEIRKIDPGQI